MRQSGSASCLEVEAAEASAPGEVGENRVRTRTSVQCTQKGAEKVEESLRNTREFSKTLATAAHLLSRRHWGPERWGRPGVRWGGSRWLSWSSFLCFSNLCPAFQFHHPLVITVGVVHEFEPRTR